MTEAQIKTLTAEYEAKLRSMVAEVKSKPYSVWNIETAYLRAFDDGIEKQFADIAAGFNEATDKKKFVNNVKRHSDFANFAKKLSLD